MKSPLLITFWLLFNFLNIEKRSVVLKICRNGRTLGQQKPIPNLCKKIVLLTFSQLNLPLEKPFCFPSLCQFVFSFLLLPSKSWSPLTQPSVCQDILITNFRVVSFYVVMVVVFFFSYALDSASFAVLLFFW